MREIGLLGILMCGGVALACDYTTVGSRRDFGVVVANLLEDGITVIVDGIVAGSLEGDDITPLTVELEVRRVEDYPVRAYAACAWFSFRNMRTGELSRGELRLVWSMEVEYITVEEEDFTDSFYETNYVRSSCR